MPFRSSWKRSHRTQSRSWRSLAMALALGSLLLLLGASSAAAAIRFAAPGGTGSAPCESSANPCSLFNAASSEAPAPTAKAGDEVALLPGTYLDTAGDLGPENHVRLPQGVSLHGIVGQSRPLILLSKPDDAGPALVVNREDTVAHIEISSGVALTDIAVGGGVVEDLIARSSRDFSIANGIVACRVFQGVIRDSACLSTGSHGIALGTRVAGSQFENPFELRNVTATATGSESFGMVFEVNGAKGVVSSLTVDGVGVIASGTSEDVVARGLTGAHVDVVLDHSDYSSTQEETTFEGGGTASITPVGTGTNIRARAKLSNDGIHELFDSPTIDAGATDGFSGAADIDGQARTLGPAPDIGADEFRVETKVSCTPATVEPVHASTCTATVLDFSTPPTTPGGEVLFTSEGSGVFSESGVCTLASAGPGEATCQLTYTPSHAGSGTHKIIASYGGDGSHARSQGSTLLQVLDPTATTLHCTPDEGSVAVGGTSTCTAFVADTFEPNTPHGKVEFASDSQGAFSRGGNCTLITDSESKSSCQLTYTPAAVGSGIHQITASYGGDAVHRPGNATALINVAEKSPTAATLNCAPGDLSLTLHDVATCTVTVAGVVTTPSGSVAFSSDSEGPSAFSNGASCRLGPSGAGEATCQLTYTPTLVGSGIHQITASYEGDAVNLSSQATDQVRVATAIRYAAPGARGPEPCAEQANPCALFTAAEGSTAKAGDEVVLAPGTYKASAGDLGIFNSVGVKEGMTLHGAAGQPRPVIDGDVRPVEVSGPVPVLLAGGSVSHIEIESSVAKIGIESSLGATGDVISRVSLAEGVACRVQGATASQTMVFRNTVCLSSGSGGVALKGEARFGASPRAATLRNVTAVATGSGSVGLEVSTAVPANLSLDGLGVIARGTAKDVVAKATHNPSSESSHVKVLLANSDYASTQTVTSEAADTTEITPAGSGTNIEAAPEFTADGFHQLRSSPTVDAGATDGLSEGVDIDGQLRTLGPAADIGADEVAPATAASLACSPGDLSLALHDVATCTVKVASSVTTPSGNVGFSSDSEGPSAFSNGASCRLEPSGANEATCQLTYTPTLVGSGIHTITASYEGDAFNLSSRASAQVRVATAIRYAAPGANGPQPCADPGNPCVLFTAAEGSTAKAGDEVVLAPGTYKARAGDLGIFNAVGTKEGMTLHGVAGKPRPVIDGDLRPAEFLGPAAVIGVPAGGSVSHIEIESSVAKIGISSVGLFTPNLGSFSDVISRVSSPEAIACKVLGVGAPLTLIARNAVCLSSGSGGVALKAEAVFGFGIPKAATLRNVTAVATGSGSVGLEASTAASAATLSLDGLGVIARGAAKDVVARAIHNPSSEASHVKVALANADYASTQTVTSEAQDTAEISPAGNGTNIKAAPEFTADGFHELGSSPTVDAGAIDGASEGVDIDGQLRVMGTAADIGADEVAPGTVAKLVCSPATVALGGGSKCTAIIEDNSPVPNIPTGPVRFEKEGQGTLSNSATCLLVPVGKSNIRASCRVTYTPSEVGTGSHKVTAFYDGDSGHNSAQDSALINVLAEKHASKTALSCSPHEVNLRSASTCSVIVTDLAENPIAPTGNVGFTSNGPGVFGGVGNACELEPLAEGEATCQLSYTPSRFGSGSHEIEATYEGGAAHLLSNDTDVISVLRNPTGTTLSCTPSRLSARATTTCTATVVDEAQANASTPEGVVNFTSDGQGAFSAESCEPQETGGGKNEASCQVTYTPASAGSGIHKLTASYEGDETHEKSEGTTPLRVVPRTETNVECEPATLALGNFSTCTATVTDIAATNPSSLDGGEVKFESANPAGSFSAPSCTLAGATTASCTVTYTASATGAHLLSAHYQADASHEASEGSFALTVTAATGNGKDQTTTALNCEPATLATSAASICTATVKDEATTGASVPSGRVEFSSDSEGAFSDAATCTLNPAGSSEATCQLTYRPTVISAHTITASYPGDATHESSEGSDQITATIETPEHNQTKTRLVCTPAARATSQASDCTATVSDESATPSVPSGEVEFASNGVGAFSNAAVCTLTPATADTASCHVAYTPVEVGNGHHKIFATYEDDGSHRLSQGTAVIDVTLEAPAKIPTQTTLQCAPSSRVTGEASTCTATIAEAPDAPQALSGEVEFASTGTGAFSEAGTCALQAAADGKSATCHLTYTPELAGKGTHKIFATYKGDDNHRLSQGSFTIVVTAATATNDTKTTITCESPVQTGTASNCIATVSDEAAANKSVPSGDVHFTSDHAGAFENAPANSCHLSPSGAAAAECNLHFTPSEVASHEISATYQADDAVHKTSTGTTTIVVTAATAKSDTETTILCNPSSTVILGGGSACTVTVRDLAAANATSPTGDVKFETNKQGTFSDSAICTLFPAGASKARCQIVYTPGEIDGHEIKAAYEGDNGHNSSHASAQLNVKPKNGGHKTTTTLDCQPSTVILGGAAACTVTVTDTAANPTSPSGGAVFASNGPGDFSSGGCVLAPTGANKASCQLIYTPSLVRSGSHEITALYPGDTSHEPSQASEKITVSPPNGGHQTATEVHCEPASVILGGASSCTATVTDKATTSPTTPGGGVIFASDGAGEFSTGGCVLAAAAGSPEATCKLTYTPKQVGETGAHKITAIYPGNPSHEPSLGSTQVNVSAPPHATTTTLACAPASLLVSANTACTATVTDTASGPSAPGGAVKFASNGAGTFANAGACTLAATGPDKSTCQVPYTPTQVGTGTHTITASYQGDGGHLKSDGTAQVQVLSAPNTIIKKKPRKKTARRRAIFRFVSDQPGSTFQCKLDRKPFKACRSPFKAKVRNGRHVLQVRAINPQGIADPTPAVYRWKVGKVKKRH